MVLSQDPFGKYGTARLGNMALATFRIEERPSNRKWWSQDADRAGLPRRYPGCSMIYVPKVRSPAPEGLLDR